MMSIIMSDVFLFYIKKLKLKLKYEKFHKSYSTFALMNLLNEILILAVTSQCHFIKLILP